MDDSLPCVAARTILNKASTLPHYQISATPQFTDAAGYATLPPSMFYGMSHIDIPVANLERARVFYVDVMGFTLCGEGEGWLDIDTSTAKLKLTQTDTLSNSVTLRIQCSALEEARAHLIEAGAEPATEIERTAELQLLTVLLDPDEHRIILWRNLTEDEYGFNPSLPTEKSWHPEAKELLHGILRNVPALFRAIARKRITAAAERLSNGTVDNDTVVRAAIVATARVMRRLLRQPLRDLGYDPDQYKAEFES